jgi:transcriptional regulator with XRE-family HTH domain
MSIGSKIRKLREDRQYSQDYVATKLNITQSAYSKIESDKVLADIDKLNQLAALYEVQISDLLDNQHTFIQSNNKVANGIVHHYDQGKEDIYKEQIEALKSEIAYLREENKKLLDKVLK